MKSFSLVILSFCFLKSFSQTSFDIRSLTYDKWKASCKYLNVKCDTFFYANKTDPETIECVIESLDKSTVYKQFDKPTKQLKIDSIIFSHNEVEEIKRQMILYKDSNWTRNLFPNSHVLNRNQIDDFIKRVDKSKLTLEEKLSKNVFTFSQPIFLRKNSICIITIEEDSILEKSGGTWIYVHKSGSWIKYAPLCLDIGINNKKL